MKTLVLPADERSIAHAVKLIKSGCLVAFPTETVYGLGADALNETAVRKIFVAKNRPADNPLIVHITDLDSLKSLTTSVSPTAQLLIDAFWPGPLSIVFTKSDLVPTLTTAGLETIVIRFPSHPVAQALIRASGTPIAAPSANLSGRVSPTSAADVLADLSTKIPLILDAGDITFGIESTVIDCTTSTPTLLRPGSITQEMLEQIIGKISNQPTTEIRSPGMKYRHYSTSTPITLLTGTREERQRKYEEYISKKSDSVSVLIYHQLQQSHLKAIALPDDLSAAAAKLYSSLLTADRHPGTEILIEGFAETGVGTAIMNRLKKAATVIL